MPTIQTTAEEIVSQWSTRVRHPSLGSTTSLPTLKQGLVTMFTEHTLPANAENATLADLSNKAKIRLSNGLRYSLWPLDAATNQPLLQIRYRYDLNSNETIINSTTASNIAKLPKNRASIINHAIIPAGDGTFCSLAQAINHEVYIAAIARDVIAKTPLYGRNSQAAIDALAEVIHSHGKIGIHQVSSPDATAQATLARTREALVSALIEPAKTRSFFSTPVAAYQETIMGVYSEAPPLPDSPRTQLMEPLPVEGVRGPDRARIMHYYTNTKNVSRART